MKYLLHFFTLLLFSAPAFCAVLYGEVRGDMFQWRTMDKSFFVDDSFVPVYWDLPAGLPAAQAWIPGSVMQNSNDFTIVLQKVGDSDEERTVSLSFEITGMEYKSRICTFVWNCIVSLDSGSSMSFIGDILSVKGTGIGNKLVTFNDTNRISPFTHLRPHVTIKTTETDLINSFEGLGDGLYQGSVTYKSQYDYYPTCISDKCEKDIKVRNTNVQKMTIQIRNYSNKLNQIEVLGSDLMQTNYSDNKKKVSAETIYTVISRGHFSNGVSVKLQPAKNKYSLKHESENSSIDYSAICIKGCIDNDFPFINNGTGRYDKTEIKTMDYERAVSEIKVSFPEQTVGDLKQGRYSGAFTLIFELNV